MAPAPPGWVWCRSAVATHEQPTLASLLICLSLGNWRPVGRAGSDAPVSSDHLAELLCVFPNLEELTVVGIASLNKVPHESLPRLSKLKRLMLVRCLSDSGDSPSPLTMSCPSIEELTLMGMSALSDTGLLHLSQCAGLTELAISTDIGVQGDGLVGDAPHFPDLKRLTVLRRYGDDFTASGFKALLDNCPNLTHFNDSVLPGEDHELALAEYVAKMQSLIQNTLQATGQRTLGIRLRDHNMNDRFSSFAHWQLFSGTRADRLTSTSTKPTVRPATTDPAPRGGHRMTRRFRPR